MSSIFKELENLESEEAKSIKLDYRELVAAIASGTEVDPQQAKQIIDRAGKTSDELHEDVKRMEHRNNLRITMKKEPELIHNMAKAQKARKKADEEFQAHREAYEDKVWPIDNEIENCNQGLRDASEAKRALLLDCSAELRKQYRNLTGEHEAAFRLIKRARQAGKIEEVKRLEYAAIEIESKLKDLEKQMLED
ncbi:MAG: hypothetical protein U0905_01845 [Pirellulales bacterium]